MNSWWPLVGLLVVLVGTTGCDPSVDTFHDNEKHYSLFGYLDASRDTQLIRVEPLRDSLRLRAPRPMNATVVLTNLETDRTVELTDEVLDHLGNSFAYNFWTTMEIEPDVPYRLSVEGTRERKSSVEIHIPDQFPTPTVVRPISSRGLPECTFGSDVRSILDIQGVDRLVAVQAIFHAESGATARFTHLSDTTHMENGVIRAQVNYGENYCQLSLLYRPVAKVTFVVAAGSSDWPKYLAMSTETAALPTVATNVRNGVGYVGGVITDTLLMYPTEEHR